MITNFDLEVGKDRDRKATDQYAEQKIKYVFIDTTLGEDTKPDEKPGTSDKSAPSGYRLAAHRYMVAKKQGLIEGPRTRTRALKFPKTVQTTSTDSEATIYYVSDSAPPPRKHRQSQKTVSQGKLITKSFVLQKDGKLTQPSRKLPIR